MQVLFILVAKTWSKFLKISKNFDKFLLKFQFNEFARGKILKGTMNLKLAFLCKKFCCLLKFNPMVRYCVYQTINLSNYSGFTPGMGSLFNTRAISEDVMFTGGHTANKHWFIFQVLVKL